MGFLRWHLGRIGAAFEPAAACLVLTGLWACIVPMALHFATRARITAVDGVPTVPGEELLIWTLKYGPPALAAFAPFALAALLAGLRLRTAGYVAVLTAVGTPVAVLVGWRFNVVEFQRAVPWEYVFSPFAGVVAAALGYCALSLFTRIRALRLRGRCRHCGYDVRATRPGTCPECGARAEPA